MSAISGIDTGTANLTGQVKSKEDAMGKDDFLLLLVAQLKNQDPMNPQDGTEFTAQLAQFSQLEQLTNVNESMQGLTTMSSEMGRLSALGLIGGEVIAQTDNFHYNGETMELGYRLEAPADDVKLYVLSESGATLATISAQETDTGQYFINWDGYSDYGMPLEPGDYSLVIRAVDSEEHLLQADPLVKGSVEAVDMRGATAELETSSGTFSMNNVEKAGAIL